MALDTGRPRLIRSRQDRVLFGVCGGLAEYFALDPVLVRVVFVLITLAGGAGVLVYLILAIVVPEAGETGTGSTEAGATGSVPNRLQNQHLLALVLIVIGLVLLAGNLGWLSWLDTRLVWPLILVALGIALLARRGGPG